MVRSPPEVCHHPTKFGCHRDCGTGDMVVVCHTNSQDHVMIDSCNFVGRSPSKKAMTLPILAVVATPVVKI